MTDAPSNDPSAAPAPPATNPVPPSTAPTALTEGSPGTVNSLAPPEAWADAVLRSAGISPDAPSVPTSPFPTLAVAPGQAEAERQRDAATGRFVKTEPPAAAATAPAPGSVKIGDQEYTLEQIQQFQTAATERARWEGEVARQLQEQQAMSARLEQERQEIQRRVWEAEQAKREAEGLKLLAMRDPAAFSQMLEAMRDEGAEPAFGPQGAEPSVSPEDRPLTLRDLQRWQQEQTRAFTAKQQEERFFATVHNAIEKGIPEATFGKFTGRIRAFVAAKMEMDRLQSRLSPAMTPAQLEFVANAYAREEQSFFGNALEEELGKRTVKAKASTPLPTSQSGFTAMPTPGPAMKKDWVRGAQDDFVSGILSHVAAINGSAGGVS